MARLGPSGPFVPDGSGLPPGSYEGQPVRWDGVSAYEPLPALAPLVFNAIVAPDDTAFGIDVSNLSGLFEVRHDGGVNLIRLSSLQFAAQASLVSLNATAGTGSGSDTSLALSTAQATIRMNGDEAFSTLRHSLDVLIDGSGQSAIQTGATASVGGELLLGFFNVTPVTRPSITGVLPQDQIDSIVAAGVALGLWTDDR